MTSNSSQAAAFAGHERASREYRRILVALLCAGVATFAQLYSVQGALPLIAAGFSVDPAQAALGVSAGTIGVAVGVLPWSWAADRFGRLPVIRASLIAAVAAGVLVPLSPAFGLFLGLRAIEGLALGGVPAIAVTYLTEEIGRAHAAVAAGTYVSGTTLGGLLGRIVAAPLGEALGWRIGVLTVALMSALATAAFAVLVPPARGFVRRTPHADPPVWRVGLRQLRTPGLRMLFAQAFLLMGGFVAIYNYLSFRLEAPPFDLRPSQASLLFLAYLAGTASSRLAGSLAGRLGRHAVLIASVVVMIGGAALTLSAVLMIVVLGLVVMTAGFFGAHSIASGWVAVRATEGRAQAASLYNLAYYTGSSVIGWLGGLAFTALGWPALIALVGALALAAAALAAGDRIRRPPEAP